MHLESIVVGDVSGTAALPGASIQRLRGGCFARRELCVSRRERECKWHLRSGLCAPTSSRVRERLVMRVVVRITRGSERFGPASGYMPVSDSRVVHSSSSTRRTLPLPSLHTHTRLMGGRLWWISGRENAWHLTIMVDQIGRAHV